MIEGFTSEQVGDQTGKTFFITGANAGIGFEAAKVLAERGGRILLGCRDRSKAEGAIRRIMAASPDGTVDIVPIDLGDLASVRAAAQRVLEEPRLDVLINNAGVMVPPFGKTKDGFELQFGVNHLGPFALTGLLLPLIQRTAESRIVNTSSNGHKYAKVDFDDLNAEKGYRAMRQYALSKLANLLHTYELDRRLKAAHSHVLSVAVHPGGTDTDLSRHVSRFLMAFARPVLKPFLNKPHEGAWPTLLAATHPDVAGGQYFGPSRFREVSGPARRVDSNELSKDRDLARRMWEVSVKLTGVDPGI